jgi:hypothetical protein
MTDVNHGVEQPRAARAPPARPRKVAVWFVYDPWNFPRGPICQSQTERRMNAARAQVRGAVRKHRSSPPNRLPEKQQDHRAERGGVQAAQNTGQHARSTPLTTDLPHSFYFLSCPWRAGTQAQGRKFMDLKLRRSAPAHRRRAPLPSSSPTALGAGRRCA